MTLTFVEFVVTLNSQNADKKLPNTVHKRNRGAAQDCKTFKSIALNVETLQT